METKVIIFDFDGVIVDSESEKRNAWVNLLKMESDPFGFTWKSFDTTALIQNAHRTWIDGTAKGSRYDIIEHMMDEVGYPSKNKETIQWYADAFNNLVQQAVLNKGILDSTRSSLERFKSHYPLYLNSATPEVNLRESAHELGITYYFKDILGKTEEKKEKSKTQNIVTTSLREGVPMSQILFIGDSESDFLAAREAGCKFIRYAEFSYGKDKTWSPKAPHTIENFAELATYLAL